MFAEKNDTLICFELEYKSIIIYSMEEIEHLFSGKNPDCTLDLSIGAPGPDILCKLPSLFAKNATSRMQGILILRFKHRPDIGLFWSALVPGCYDDVGLIFIKFERMLWTHKELLYDFFLWGGLHN